MSYKTQVTLYDTATHVEAATLSREAASRAREAAIHALSAGPGSVVLTARLPEAEVPRAPPRQYR